MTENIINMIINKFQDFTIVTNAARARPGALNSDVLSDSDTFMSHYNDDRSFRNKLINNCIYNKKTYIECIYKNFSELDTFLKPEFKGTYSFITYWEGDDCNWKAHSISISKQKIQRCLKLSKNSEEFIALLKTKPLIIQSE